MKSLHTGISLLLSAALAQAAEITWIAGDGDFEAPENWSTGTMPESEDNPVFTNPGTFTIDFHQSASTKVPKLRTDNGPVDLTFKLNRCYWDFNNGSDVKIKGSNSGTFTFLGGELRRVKGAVIGESSENIEVVFDGEESGVTSSIGWNYKDGNGKTLPEGYSDHEVTVGDHGKGVSLKILNGAHFSSPRGLCIGSDWDNWDSENNLVLVSGEGSVLYANPYPIKEENDKKWAHENGNNGLPNGGRNNNLIIENGASFLSSGKKFGTEQPNGGGTMIGYTSASDNMVIVRNNGTFKLGENGSRLLVGFDYAWNNGLLVTDNSRAVMGSTTIGFCNTTSNNWITVEDGSSMKISGKLYIGGTEGSKCGKNCDRSYNGDARGNTFNVQGEGAVSTNTDYIYIGWRGAENAINVTTGGTLVAQSRISLGQAAATANANALNIVGEGAAVRMVGSKDTYTIGIGRYGVSNLVYVADGGLLDMTNTVAKPLYVGLGHDAATHSGNADNKLHIDNGTVVASDLILTNASHFVMQGASSSAEFDDMIVGGNSTIEFLFDEDGIGTVTLDGSLKLSDLVCGDDDGCGVSEILIDAMAFTDAGKCGTFTLLKSKTDSASDFADNAEILSRIRVRPLYIRPVLDLSKSSLDIVVPLQQTLILLQ